MADERALQALAARQHGLASREQLLRLGFTARQITGRSTRGLWLRAAPQVFDVAPGSTDPLRALQAAVLSTGGLASHRSAAHLLGLIDTLPPVPELLVPCQLDPRRLCAVVHRTQFFAREDRSRVGAIACTAPLRTLHDLASVADPEELEDAVARAFTRRLASPRRLHRYLDRSLVGRRGAKALRTAADLYVDRTEETMSRLEVLVDRAVRTRGIPRPVRQLRVRFPGRYFDLDLAWPGQMVFVEADGYAAHSSPKQLRHDRERQNLLVLAGWLPLRYTWWVARHDPSRVEREVVQALGTRRHL
jgi:very-short-patch-repair endonuclease